MQGPTHGKIFGSLKAVVTMISPLACKLLFLANDLIVITLDKCCRLLNHDLVNLIRINRNAFIGTQPCATSWQTIYHSMTDPLPQESETGVLAL